MVESITSRIPRLTESVANPVGDPLPMIVGEVTHLQQLTDQLLACCKKQNAASMI